MHKKIITEGIVLSKKTVGESNVLVQVLTRELGLIRARVQSARVEHSKLRYGIEPLTFGRFCFIQGAYEWRLVGVERTHREFMPHGLAERRTSGRVTKLLLRLVSGEEPSAQLFHAVADGLGALVRAENAEQAQSVEAVLVLRILSHLGYLPHVPELVPFIEAPEYTAELSAQALVQRRKLVRAINESLQATGL